MGLLVLVKYVNFLDNECFFFFNDFLFMEIYDLFWDEEEQFFVRDIDYFWCGMEEDKKEVNGKKIFWSWGNGWVMGGLVRLLEELLVDYYK